MPDNSTPCARREVSTVAPQALMLLNSPLAVEAAHAFAERVEHDAGKEPASQIQRAFELALQRPPDEFELAACERLLSRTQPRRTLPRAGEPQRIRVCGLTSRNSVIPWEMAG